MLYPCFPFFFLPHLENSCTDNSSEAAFRASRRQKVYPETFTRVTDAEKAHGLVNELLKVRTAIAVLWQNIYWAVEFFKTSWIIRFHTEKFKLIIHFNFGTFTQQLLIAQNTTW